MIPFAITQIEDLPLELIWLPLIDRDHILKAPRKPIPGFSMNGNNVIRVDLLYGPSDILSRCMARGMILLFEAWDPVFVQGEPAGFDVEAFQPVPEPLEVDLHLLVKSLA